MKTDHRTELTHVGEDKRKCQGSTQWLLELPGAPRVHHDNHLQVHICGEDSFASIARDIANAKKSIDLICWGFDPAMELERKGEVWPRGVTYGDLLADAADRGAQVRLLCWYDYLGSSAPHFGNNNMPGYSKQDAGSPMIGDRLPRSKRDVRPRGPGLTQVSEINRIEYNFNWYRKVFDGLGGIDIKTRNGNDTAAEKSLHEASHGVALSQLEELTLEEFATHHQKTILIDYEGDEPVGYVMGLNSVTDYWDTRDHLFNDPRRGASWEGQGDAAPILKPYQDFVCRVQGPALMELNKNFESAWRRAQSPPRQFAPPPGTTLAPHLASSAPRAPSVTKRSPEAEAARLARSVAQPLARQRAQIVRTQPEETETTIERLYRLATSQARKYVYVENQYFQYTPWATQLKADRTAFVEGWKKARRSLSNLPNLHVMVVIPTPEKTVMIPRTYDTVQALGHGTSMPNQDDAINKEIKRFDDETAAYERGMAQQKKALAQARLQSQGGLIPYESHMPAALQRPRPLSDIAASAKSAGEKEAMAKELETLGIRTLIASLWTHDENWRTTQRKDLEVLAEWAEMPGQVQRYKALNERLMAARYREIYIHSKLLLIDDSFFTLGSANLNLRSMAVDSEINVASDDMACSTDLRARVWGMHSGDQFDGGDGSAATIKETFKNWEGLLGRNRGGKAKGGALDGFLVPFEDKRTSNSRLG
jgi:phosphatidylserine/phosphatidylglycerophosphate/cardiolipin synthase-like enzyme